MTRHILSDVCRAVCGIKPPIEVDSLEFLFGVAIRRTCPGCNESIRVHKDQRHLSVQDWLDEDENDLIEFAVKSFRERLVKWFAERKEME